jgi:hypothetical protein
MDDPMMRIWMPVVDILGGFAVAFAYAILFKGIPGSGIKKGIFFGLILWLVTRFVGELFFYVMSPIPFMIVIAGWIHGLFVAVLGGAALAAIYGKSLEG